MRKAIFVALLGANLLVGCSSDKADVSLTVAEPEPEAEEGVAAEDTPELHISSNLSTCATAKLAKYASSRYAMLTLWKTTSTSANDSFVTADPDWQGCGTDMRLPPVRTAPSGYQYQADLGLVFRADLPQPAGTVPLVTYYVKEGSRYDFATLVADATTKAYDTKLRVEGYVYPWDWRVPGSGFLSLLFRDPTAADTDASTRITTSPAPAESGPDVVVGYIMDPASVVLDKNGKCDSDADCASSQHCFITSSDSRFSDGTLGTCMRACRTSADCTDEGASRCDIMRQHCVDPLVRYDRLDAVERRSTGATYQIAADQMKWAQIDELRWEDLGDGYGPQPLLEGSSSNYVLFSNRFDPFIWSASTTVSVTESKSSPGPHPGVHLAVADSSGTVFARYGNTSTTFAAPTAGFTMSLWRRTVRQSVQARWYDQAAAMVSGGTSLFAFETPLIPGWSRAQINFTNFVTGPINFYIGEAVPAVGDERDVAYLQAEPLQFATSAIPTNGALGTRAADDLRVTTKNLSQSFRLIAFPEANAGTASGIQTLFSLLDAAGAEVYSIQLEPVAFNTSRLRYFKPTATITSPVALAYLKNNPLIVDVDYTGSFPIVRLWGAGNSTGVSLTLLSAPTTVAGARIGARPDGSAPFYGRISEPLPLGRGTDQVPARLVNTRLDPSLFIMAPTLYASYSEHIASGTATVASLNRSRSIATGFGSVVGVPLAGLFDPGRMHTITMSATDVGGNTSSSSVELLAPGSAYPGPGGELVRLRADASSGTAASVAVWEDMSGRNNDALYVASAGPTARTQYGPGLRKQAMVFRGASEQDQLELRSLNTANVQGTDYTMFVVFARTATGIQPLWASANASLTVNASGNVEFKQGSSVLTSTATVATNTPTLAIVRVQSSGVRELTINSLAPVSQTVAGTTTSLSGYLGRNLLATPNYLTGELGEFVIYQQWLADSDRDTIRNFFKATYGIP